jgi:hypothetical protein
MKPQTALEPYKTKCLEELEKRAARAAATTQDTIVAGNSVVIFTMMVLQETLEQLAIYSVKTQFRGILQS